MKYTIISILLCFKIALVYPQATFQSQTSGNWGSAATWTIVAGSDSDGNNYPDANDFVTIMAANTVSITSTQYFKSLIIQSGGFLKSTLAGINFGAKGNIDIQGTVIGKVNLYIQSTCTFNSATTYTNLGNWVIQAGTLNITSSTTISKPAATIAFQNSSTRTVNNFGNVVIGYIAMNNAACIWNNRANSNLTLTQPSGISTTGVLNATAIPNNVTYSCTTGNSIKPSTYYNLILDAASTKSITNTLNVLNDLTLNAGNILDANNFNINVGGNWINNSVSSVTNQATINFNGTITQNINGTQANVFNNLSLSNAAGLIVNAGVSVTDAITVNNGDFNSNDNVTLLSDASNTARIAPVGAGGSFSGNMTIQKHISARSKNWHDFSSPVQGTTIYDWDDEMYMSGFSNIDSPAGIAGVDGNATDSAGNRFFSAQTYKENTASYAAVTNSATVLTPGKGYEIWTSDNMSSWNSKTIDSRGVPNFGTKNITLSFTGSMGVYAGWNLIGNPFASPIDYSLVTKTNTDGHAYGYNNGVWTDFGTNAIITPHQGFWAYATSIGGSITIPESSKSAVSATSFYRLLPNYAIKLIYTNSDVQYFNEANVNFDNFATTKWDIGLDAIYRNSPDAQASTVSFNTGEMQLLTNAINNAENNVTLPLDLFSPKTGLYYIQASVLNTDDYKYAWIENIKTGEKFDLNKSIPVNIEKTGENSDFVLRLSKTSESSEISQTVFANDLMIFNSENILNLKSNKSNHALSQITIFDLSGKLVFEQKDIAIEENSTYKFDISNLNQGVYVVNAVDVNGNSISKKIIK